MANAKQRVENIQYVIQRTEKLLNKKDKESEAYKEISKDLQGLRSALRVAESRLIQDITAINRKITKTLLLQANARTEKDKAKCEKTLVKLRAKVAELKFK